MANQRGHRRFGNVRKRPSGRFQARYVGPDGLERTAPTTFETERAALKWLTLIEAEIIKGEWSAPESSEVKLSDYAARWIAERKLQDRSRENYEDLLRLNIVPYLGHLLLGSIKPQTIRSWRKKMLDDGRPEPQAVKSYSLLRAVLNTAMKEDRIIRENPCRIKGFDKYHTPERPIATMNQVFGIADAMPPRFRALILVAAFSSLRWGELAALRRCDVDLDAGTVRVPRKLAALRTGLAFGQPKSEAGKRTVAVPAVAIEALRQHLSDYTKEGAESIIFTGPRGALLRTGHWAKHVGWSKVLSTVGTPAGFTFHDLRHTGNHLASASGASTRELMRRMGHSSMRAALIYQHATDDRDQEIAASMEERIAKQSGRRAKKPEPPKVEDPDEGSDDVT